LGADFVVSVNCSSPLYSEKDLIYPWIIADQIVSIPMKILNTRQLETSDYIITPQLDSLLNSDFSNLPRVIQIGYDAAKPVAVKLKNDIESKIRDSFGDKKTYYKNLNAAPGSDDLTKAFMQMFVDKDSVSSNDLLYELNKMQNSGAWKSLSIDINENGGKCFVTLNAVENPLITNFNINGVTLINKSVLWDKLSPLNFKPYSPQNTFMVALDILRYYKEQGYSLTRIEKISFNDSTHILTFDFNEGLISQISVEGNLKTKEKIITSALPFKVGDYFRYDLAAEGLANLRSTNLFDQIELSAIENDGQYKLKLEVIEKISSVIRFGMRIDNEYLTQATVDVRDENFNGSGAELGAIFTGGTKNLSVVLEQRANRVFDSYLTYKIRAFGEFKDIGVYEDDIVTSDNEFSRSKTGEYRQINYGGMFGLGAQVEKFANIFVEARYQRDEINNRSNYNGSIYKMDISSLRFSLSLDTQNDYPYPTSGFFINAYYETAQTALGGDIGYTKLFIDYKNILSFHSTNTWSFRAMMGSADNTLPLSQQFSFGGQNSFFGFRENEYRGCQVLVTSLEYRYKLPFRIFFDTYIKARYDLGSVWGKREQIRLEDLRHGVGATISFNTPIGPADFSVGRSFYLKNKLSENTFVWGSTFFYFTIGYYY
jgi:NTE family protein